MALGCLGLSYDDFCALSPDEYRMVNRYWVERETERLHGEWERTRVMATYSVQPHLKKPVDARKLLPLPWDRKAGRKAPPSTRARFDEIVRKTRENVDNQHNLQVPGGCEIPQGTDE